MKKIYSILLLSTLVACSSQQKKNGESTFTDIDQITNKDFKKEPMVEKSQVKDYFQNNQPNLENPVLKDETMALLTSSEADAFEDGKDPLVTMAYLCTKGKFKEAYTIAAKSYDRFQKLPSYWNQLGICYMDQREYRKSLLYFNKAIEAERNYVPALNNFGVMYSRQGQYQKAVVAFEKAADIGKFAKTPRYNLARLYLKFGLAQKALPILQSLANSSQTDVGITNAIGTSYLMQGNFQSAWKYYQQIPKNLWERADIGVNIAYAVYKSGNANSAKDIFEGIKKPKDPSIKEYYEQMAQKIGVKI